ncbi:hypothetical protein VCHENC02_2010A, partial [Vibrio harveyi]
MLTGHLHDL